MHRCTGRRLLVWPRPGTDLSVDRRRASRPPVKQDLIIDDLRGRILDHSYPPGSRLPRRADLQLSFQVSSVTIQRALDRLIEDGFVEARGRQGTFVSAHPPHRCNYGLLFPGTPEGAPWVRFWTALANEAQALACGRDVTISRYYGIDGHQEHEDYQRLVRDIHGRRLAGLILATAPKILAATPVMTQGDLPRVAVMPFSTAFPGVVPLVLSVESFIDQALGYLHERGRTRVALLAVPGHLGRFHSQLRAGLEARGMSSEAHWLQICSPSAPEGARYITHLLMNDQQRQRPDALLITDDNLVEHATVGLIAAGVRVPDDCDIVAHCNFPWPTPSMLPVRRLGYDARQLLVGAMAEIDRQRAGAPPAPRIDLAARFEEGAAPPWPPA
jgi:DNA-binding LacI/PurR family transcriptional regulator